MAAVLYRSLVFLAVSLVDWMSTHLLVGEGLAIEANPVAAQFAHDPWHFLAFKATLVAVVVLTAVRLAAHRVSWAANALAVASAVTVLVAGCGLATVPLT